MRETDHREAAKGWRAASTVLFMYIKWRRRFGINISRRRSYLRAFISFMCPCPATRTDAGSEKRIEKMYNNARVSESFFSLSAFIKHRPFHGGQGERLRWPAAGVECLISWKALRFINASVQCWIWSRAVRERVLPVESLALFVCGTLYWGEFSSRGLFFVSRKVASQSKYYYAVW